MAKIINFEPATVGDKTGVIRGACAVVLVMPTVRVEARRPNWRRRRSHQSETTPAQQEEP